MPKITQYSLNGNAGALVNIVSTIPARYVEVTEDASGAVQGLTYQTLNDNFVGTYVAASGQEPVTLGNKVAIGNAAGNIVGWPAQTSIGSSATILFKMKSGTATATKVNVTEYE